MKRGWRLIAFVIAVAACTGCGVLKVNIEGEAMSPTLKNGESALATRNIDIVNRGDIVAFKYPKDESKSFVKRIVGMPFDKIAMKDGRVLINDILLDEPYVSPENRSLDDWGPITVATDEYFVLGDNRRNSSDSRMWGTVRRTAIWARVLAR